MRKLTLTLLAGSALALAGCGGNKAGNNSAAANGSSFNASGMDAGNGIGGMGGAADMNASGGPSAATGTPAAGTNTASAWPDGSRIVTENGVTYRIDRGGARVRLEANDSRIVVENGVRYRVDPDGARVRIDQRGFRIGDSTIRGNAPNGRSDVETPGEAALDAAEDAAEAVSDVVDPPRRGR